MICEGNLACFSLSQEVMRSVELMDQVVSSALCTIKELCAVDSFNGSAIDGQGWVLSAASPEIQDHLIGFPYVKGEVVVVVVVVAPPSQLLQLQT